MSKYSDLVLPAMLRNAGETLRQFDRELVAALGTWSMTFKAILDKGIALGDNVDAVAASYTSNGTPDTEDAVAHTLGKAPIYFIVADANKGAVVYRGATAFTKTHVYLKCTQASTAITVILL